MQEYLRESDYVPKSKPTDLACIYGAGHDGSGHGVRPDYSIMNQITGKTVFVELKRQRAKGNAHERACKFMMPGIVNSARRIARQGDSVIPFWWVFSNGIASSPRYIQEILHWFQGIEGHVLLWDDLENYVPVINHFENHIRPLLE